MGTPTSMVSGSPPQVETSLIVATSAQHVTVPEDLLNKMANHHITVNYLVIGVLILVLACGGVGAYFGLKGYNKLMDRAEASEKLTIQYEKSWQDSQQQVKVANELYEKELTAHAVDRAADAQKLLNLTKALQILNANADQHMHDVTQPGKSAEQAFLDLKDAYKMTPFGGTLTLNATEDKESGEKLMTFPVLMVQQFTSTKIDRDRLFDSMTNLNQQLGTKQKDFDSLGLDFKNLQATYNTLKESDNQLQLANGQCLDTVKKYKAVTVKTKWQKIWAGTKKGLYIGGSLIAGYELGKHL
jgi:hypothetical protein